ncbi:bifunctional diguanylate cyclase/phosphodiesterase [Amnibacterium sp.]|uniref:putative bifunctional diguanylate cyclase/phosphodiesterase n=1 Tax=Amnibacterium sp. TaxID=1872496 RepID=UPI0026291127|nr:bifunctional diguanylate cyclase/phosphodiesterase [Amnibacterium sp.]MCU1474620.1 diguanylate cyclase/phosphodiesterase with and sensor(s) [Amnibacterium sp.]
MCESSGSTASDEVPSLEALPERSEGHTQPTGPPNRGAVEGCAARACRPPEDRAAIAVIFCDIDGLRRSGDDLGPGAGVQVLAEVAARLRGGLRPGDTVSRIAGDQFVVVLDRVAGENEVQSILRRLEDSLAAPLAIGDGCVSIRLSTGLAFSRDPLLGDDAPAAARTPVRPADLTMYQRMNRASGALRGLPLGRPQMLARDLPGAAERGEITVLYQAQVDLATGGIVAVEALARWAHPALGTVYPDEFIPLAELIGEITSIGHAVVRQACQDLARLRARHPRLGLAVNVSVDELGSPRFVRDLCEVLDSAGLPPAALTIELTESKLPEDPLVAVQQLSEVGALGVGIALDDFGTGYTSLAQLRDVPVTEIKVDRSFVRPPEPSPPDLLSGIVGLARGLGLRTVAEGVCSEEDLERVREAGFDRGQGFGLGAPVEIDELAKRLGDAAA